MVNDTIDSIHHLRLTLYISKLRLDNLYEYLKNFIVFTILKIGNC